MKALEGFKDVFVLTLIAVAAAAALSYTHLSTKEKIASVKAQAHKRALKSVLPFLQKDFKEENYEFKGKTYKLYCVYNGEQFLGAALELVATKGYAGNIVFLLGVNDSEKVSGFSILYSQETPGLGSKAQNKKFWKQFVDKSLASFRFAVQKDGGDVVAITASTITSRALSDEINQGLVMYHAFLQQKIIKKNN